MIALHWPRPKTGIRTQITFGMMLAGTVGNLTDRLVFGHVTDFIDVVPWFIFNVADVAILIGCISFVMDIPTETRRFFDNLKHSTTCEVDWPYPESTDRSCGSS